MIDTLKQKISNAVVQWQLKDRRYSPRSFEGFFRKSFAFLVLMPKNESDFHHALKVLEGLSEAKKKATIFTYDFKVSLIPMKFRPQVIDHGVSDVNSINLPSKKLVSKLSDYNFQVVLDLNREQNTFYSYVASLIDVPIRVGFSKENADKFYNVQLVDNGSSAEISYKNFLNFLLMFD